MEVKDPSRRPDLRQEARKQRALSRRPDLDFVAGIDLFSEARPLCCMHRLLARGYPSDYQQPPDTV